MMQQIIINRKFLMGTLHFNNIFLPITYNYSLHVAAFILLPVAPLCVPRGHQWDWKETTNYYFWKPHTKKGHVMEHMLTEDTRYVDRKGMCWTNIYWVTLCVDKKKACVKYMLTETDTRYVDKKNMCRTHVDWDIQNT